LPLAIGQLPGELIGMLQVISISRDLLNLEEKLKAIKFELIVNKSFPLPLGLTIVCDKPPERTQAIIDNTERLVKDEQFGAIRYRGGLSSFSIPDKPSNHRIWQLRDGGELYPQRSEHDKDLLRRERQALEKHVRNFGCTLILDINDLANVKGDVARITRLMIIKEFLEKTPESMTKVVCMQEHHGELLLVGDHFFAYASTLSRYGINRTEFHFHPVEVFQEVSKFDEEFIDLEHEYRTDKSSAIDAITRKISELKETLSPTQISQIEDVFAK
jgi:hypothetical protein